jgi:hypothetical protein
MMGRTIVVIAALAMLGAATQVEAQGRGNRSRQNGQTRQEIARAQGVPPGQLPPANLCRVWYNNRPNGRQPAATSCRQAEVIAARDRNARVIYGENVYGGYGYGNNRDMRYPGDWERETGDRGVYRVPGRNRDPRAGNDPYYDRSRYTSPAFQNGYRDGLAKGREDGDDNDRYDVSRHSWYRSATRGYEDEYGTRAEYQARYREGFEAGYSEGYRAYSRR